MARAGCRTNGLQKLEGNDIEKSLEVLDKVLSEYEYPDSLPHIPIQIERDSPSQGNQSEDDGYMSMNGRRAKLPPDVQEGLHNESSLPSPPPFATVMEGVIQPPSPSDTLDETIIDGLLLSSLSSPSTSDEAVDLTQKEARDLTPTPPAAAQSLITPEPFTSISLAELSTSLKLEEDDNDRINNAKNLQNDLCQFDNVNNISSAGSPADEDEHENKLNVSTSSIVSSAAIDVEMPLLKELEVPKTNEINPPETLSHHNIEIEKKPENCIRIIKKLQEIAAITVAAQQSTLPKARPSNGFTSKYSSLPCSGPGRNAFGTNLDRFGHSGGSFDGGNFNDRNILGIGISAVHDAVLRGGVAKLPEPIVNEHPVTIYPGRASPPGRRVPPRTLPGSIERHREVCRNADSTYLPGSPNTTTTTPNYDYTDSNYGSEFSIPTTGNIIGSDKITQYGVNPKSPPPPTIIGVQQHLSHQLNNINTNHQLTDNKNLLNNLQISHRNGDIVLINNSSNNNNNNHHHHHHHNHHKSIKRMSASFSNNLSSDSSAEFSDDSLDEHVIMPTQSGTAIMPSLSAPVTPNKRGSIAWEINLDDDEDDDELLPPPHLSGQRQAAYQQQHHRQLFASRKMPVSGRRTNNGTGRFPPFKLETLSGGPTTTIIGGIQTPDSQSSLASTPGHSGDGELISDQNSPDQDRQMYQMKLRNRSNSMEWPESIDPVPSCTTEDEATSIYSDSDDVIPLYPINMTGKGTYVIRKGRKERKRLPDIHLANSLSSAKPRLSDDESLLSELSNNQSILVASSRHSIDLEPPIHSTLSPIVNCVSNTAMLSPRSRLSLDLNHIGSDHISVSLKTILSGGTSSPAVVNSSKLNQQPQASSNSGRYADFNKYGSYETGIQQHETNVNGGGSCGNLGGIGCSGAGSNSNLNDYNNLSSSTGSMNGSITRFTAPKLISDDIAPTPRRELAPPIEEDEEQDSESQSRGAPLREIENNISALLRGDISVARAGDISHSRRPLGFRPGVHKSESAKEMLLSQTAFGPLPPSPPASSPEPEIEVDEFPPLPPSPQNNCIGVVVDEVEINEADVVRGLHGIRLSSRSRVKTSKTDILTTPAPAVPPHRTSLGYHQQPSLNTLKTRSMDAGYTKKYSTNLSHGSVPGTLPGEMPSNASRRRLQSGAFPKRISQSPREERRLQTSCSLPETPIFARGCDIPRTPHRRAPEAPCTLLSGGSRTAPRTNSNTQPILGSSIVGIGNTLGGGRRPLAGAEMLRLSGGPARGWYPKQRTMRPVSTEHLDRLHRSQCSMRAWDTTLAGGSNDMPLPSGGMCAGRKPLTLPPNLTPKFFNKSPREALRRVTSLLIKKGSNAKDKESKQRDKEGLAASSAGNCAPELPGNRLPVNNSSNNTTGTSTTLPNNHQQQATQVPATQQKKKGFFKNLWKKSKHYSLDQQQ